MLILRDHQNKFIEDIRSAFDKSKWILAQAPVGFGKTVISAYMGKRILEKGKTMFFCVHTKDLLTQTYKAFNKFNIPFGIIAAGYPESRKAKIQICSIPTLKKRLTRYKAPDMVVIDECHFCGAAGWAKMVEYYKSKGSFGVGLSASPWRLSGEGLGDQFDVMVNGPSTRWLIDNKYLSEYRMFAPASPNLEGVHIRMGDYVQSEIEVAMNRPSITGCAIVNYKKYANGKNAIAFCVSVKHSEETAAAFNSAGIPAVHLDGEDDVSYRRKVIRDFADGTVKIITNCALFSAGFDLSLQVDRDITVESVILLRPTMSLSLNIQMTGRALRYKPYPAIILDHANCCRTHGLPDDDRVWTLKGIDKNRGNGEKAIGVRICASCFSAQRPGSPVCQFCGHVFEIKYRKVDHQDGELSEVDIVAARRVRLAEQGTAHDYAGLVALGKKRGYKNPYLWSKFVLRARKQRQEIGNGT